MRIDDRKVNGRIMIEPENTVRTWMIAVSGQKADWFAGHRWRGESDFATRRSGWSSYQNHRDRF